MKKVLMFTLVVVLLVGMVFTGCAPKAMPVEEPAAEEPAAEEPAAEEPVVEEAKKIVFIQGVAGDEFYITMAVGMQAVCDELGYELEVTGAQKWDYTLQTPIVESLVARASEIDMVVMAPTHPDSLIPPMEKLVKAGVPIITVDTNINDDTIALVNITSDNLQGGKVAADMLAEMIGGAGKVAIMNTNVGVTTTEARAKGFLDQIEAAYPDIEVVSHEYCENEAEKAATMIQATVLKNPDLAGVFGTNLYSSIGAFNGLSQAGVEIPVFSYDAGPAHVEALAAGDIQATVVQRPGQIGAEAVNVAQRYFEGETSFENVMIENVIATTENMNDPEISKWFYVAE